MDFYFAPMEGITGYIYRNAHARYFGGIDKYFTPFIMPNQNRCMNSKELNDVLPEHNQGVNIVPQILTNKAEDFLKTTEKLKDLGYIEVNLNLGCPSRTVVSKGKGAGFLEYPDRLEDFLDRIFEKTSLKISLKTRLGMYEPKEFYRLLEIFNKFPLSELIIHPRVQTDYYKNKPVLEIYRKAEELSGNILCYNGDLFTRQDYEVAAAGFSRTNAVMMGRGLLRNPNLVHNIRHGEQTDKKILKAFHDEIYEGYRAILPGEKPVLFKMKELWTYMLANFPEADKCWKKIKKADRLAAYDSVIMELFSDKYMCG